MGASNRRVTAAAALHDQFLMLFCSSLGHVTSISDITTITDVINSGCFGVPL
jgi:hypothetical protein